MGRCISSWLLVGILALPLFASADDPFDQVPDCQPWLDEVRLQREAWEARRDAVRESVDAHRRLVDPWGAAQHDAMERESQRFRDAARQHADQHQQAAEAQRQARQREREERWRSAEPYPPPGWDNPWYYRGY